MMNMGQNSTTFPLNLSILDGKNWNRKSAQTRFIFRYQEVLEIVENGFAMINNKSNDEEKAAFKLKRRHK
ncbi:hypothetical protein Lal_00049926 [Lupinus albus]|nr:hypothetical protein Lal_00049926 [Lupinus albus]